MQKLIINKKYKTAVLTKIRNGQNIVCLVGEFSTQAGALNNYSEAPVFLNSAQRTYNCLEPSPEENWSNVSLL